MSLRSALCFMWIACFAVAGYPSPVMAASAQAISQHQRILARPNPVYVAVGASDSFGIGADDPLTQSWPHDVANKLEAKPHLINLGIPGATMDLAVRAELPIALSVHPTLISVWLGVNDIERHVSLATFSLQLQALLNSLAQQTSAAIYVGNIPDLTLLPYFSTWDQTALSEQILSWNAAISFACSLSGAHLVDIFAQGREMAAHPDYLGKDQFHPSTQGAQAIADLFVEAMTTTSTNTMEGNGKT
ncbi:MAG TPA: SGNH/GDSL hydrolase family protein [Ktedonobacterales bacterium]|jgi:acyl-CoA thioesterase I|nr:SGNH/GDSL hydrolase family protein [Ktedonobacterales bacterium]